MPQHRLLQRLLLALCVALAACSPTTSAARPGFGTVALHRHAKLGTVAVDLGTLSFNSNILTTGTPANGSILGATPTSTVTASGLPAGLTINGVARTWAWDGTGSVSAGNFTLTETLAGYANSPHANSIGYSIIAPAGTVAYDTSIGNGVDASGFASLPLHAGAHVYFVKPSGSDANDCTAAQNSATPKATVAGGMGCIVNGAGDQVLLAEGATFAEAIPWLGGHAKDGFSPTYPTVISSYDPADPTNTAKYGRGDQRAARPILTVSAGLITSGLGPKYLAIKGLHFNPGNLASAGLSFVAVDNDPPNSTQYVLAENNLFDYTTLSFDLGPGTAYVGQHIVVRNNAMHGMWSTGGITGCLYTAGTDGATAEDNVFYHCGWNEAGDRTQASGSGGPTIFQHSYYFQTTTTNVIARRNLSIEGGGDCGIARGDITVTESLFIDCPNAMGLGTGPAYNTDFGSSDGVNIVASYNVALGADDVFPGHPLGWGITTGNGLPGSHADHNIFVRSQVINDGAATLFSNIASDTDGNGSVPPSYMTFDSNVGYLWNPSGSTYFTQTDSFAPQVHTTYTNNKWDDVASGSNVQSAAGLFPNPYTAASFYAAMGYADRNALVAYAIVHPEAHIQRTGLDLLLAGYGISHTFGPSLPTLSDLALSSTTFARGTPSSGSITGATLGSSIGATGPPSGLTFNGGARTWAWDGTGSGAASGTFTLTETLAGATNTPRTTTISYSITSPTSVTWATNGDWTLSNAGATATRTGTSTTFWGYELSSAAHTNWTAVVTVNAMGSATNNFVGVNDGTESSNPGTFHSIYWRNDGALIYDGGLVTTLATWTTADQLKIVKAAGTITFYKWNGSSFIQQGSPIDTTNVSYGLGNVLAGNAYLSLASQNATGFQGTADFSAF